jgi:glycosyltransferase involved in cell wall biosynthesis
MYPPHSLGGYELVWQGAVAHLRAAGHDVSVLTTDHREEGVHDGDEPDVHRTLRWYWRDHRFPRISPWAAAGLERHNGAVLEARVAQDRPDVIAWFAMGGMSLALIERARRAGLPAAGFVHDDWMVYGPRVDAWMRRARRLGPLRPVAEALTGVPTTLDLDGAASWWFVSEHTRERARGAGWLLPDAGVASSGIAPAFLDPAPRREWEGRLLTAGRLDPRKGALTAVGALAQLPGATLRVAGAGDDAHAQELLRRAGELGAGGRVELLGALDRIALHREYGDADAVLFPVTWEEPWGLVPLEAMGRGRPVVATGLGGSAEYLEDGANCLLVPPGDAHALAAAVQRLATDPGLRERLVARGLETAAANTAERFDAAVLAALEAAAAKAPA